MNTVLLMTLLTLTQIPPVPPPGPPFPCVTGLDQKSETEFTFSDLQLELYCRYGLLGKARPTLTLAPGGPFGGLTTVVERWEVGQQSPGFGLVVTGTGDTMRAAAVDMAP